MIFPFFAFFSHSSQSYIFFLLSCCYFVSDDNMEIYTYWYSYRDLPSQIEAKKLCEYKCINCKDKSQPAGNMNKAEEREEKIWSGECGLKPAGVKRWNITHRNQETFISITF